MQETTEAERSRALRIMGWIIAGWLIAILQTVLLMISTDGPAPTWRYTFVALTCVAGAGAPWCLLIVQVTPHEPTARRNPRHGLVACIVCFGDRDRDELIVIELMF